MTISIKKITENDWREVSEMRLKALLTDPAAFGSCHQREASRTEAEWQDWIKANDAAIFMLYERDTAIGMTGIMLHRDDTANETALLWGSWLEPGVRRRGLSKLMYETRIDWARNHPTVKRIIVAHRASNLSSKYANRQHGFVFTHRVAKVWNDGITEDVVSYELHI